MSNFSKILIFSVLGLIGLALIPLLRLQYLPQSTADSITVSWSWSGAAPEHVERNVTSLLESSFALIDGISEISSISSLNRGRIDIKINDDRPFEYVKYEIASKIRQAYPALPEGVSYPKISDNIPDDANQRSPILIYSVNSSSDPAAIYEYLSSAVVPRLSFVSGVDQVNVTGYRGRELYLSLDEYTLDNMNIRRSEILSIIRDRLKDRSLGYIHQDGLDQSIKMSTDLSIMLAALPRLPDDSQVQQVVNSLLDTPISNQGGAVIRLRDLGQLAYTSRPASSYYRVNGRNSLRLLVYADDDANEIQAAEAVQEEMRTLIAQLPPGYQLVLEDDATEYLSKELKKVYERSLLALLVIILFTAISYRSWRYLWVICYSLVINLGIASIFYYLLGIEIHLYALAGITISFGIVVDNAIVMAHHYRQTRNRQVFPALLASTLTTIASLSIIFFLPDIWQQNLLAFMQVITINLWVSLLVALLFIPAMLPNTPIHKTQRSSLYNRRIVRWSHRYESLLALLLRRRRWMIGFVILLFGLPIFLLPNRIDGWDLYNKSLGSDWYIENAKPLVNRALGGTLRLFSWYVYDGAHFGEPKETLLYVNGRMPLGTTLEQMNEVYIRLEQYLSQYNIEISQYSTRISSGQQANLIIKFNEGHDDIFPYQLKSRIQRYCLGLGGVTWNVYGVGKGFSNSNASQPPRYQVYMYGYNDVRLSSLADEFEVILTAHPRVQEVDTEGNVNWYERDLYAYDMTLDPAYMAYRNISPQSTFGSLQRFDKSIHPDLYLTSFLPLRIKDQNLHNQDKWAMMNKSLTINDQPQRIGSFADLEKKKVSSSIHKKDQQFIKLCEFEYTGSGRFGQQHLDKSIETMRAHLPIGYTMEQQSYSWGREEVQKQYALILLVIGLIFFICAVHFESLRQAAAIVVLIPTSFIGIFLTFYLGDFGFDQGGYVSFIFLSGLVVNSIILLISEYNQLSRSHPHSSSTVTFTKAISNKIMPILLTIVSTIVGLVPFLIHGSDEVFWFSLAVGTIGGLVFSLFVLFLFIPLFVVKIKP